MDAIAAAIINDRGVTMPETSATASKTGGSGTATSKPKGILTQIKEYFGYGTLKSFSDDWKALDDVSKTQMRTGIENGTQDYTPTPRQITESKARTEDYSGVPA
jgi:hypothetical protein